MSGTVIVGGWLSTVGSITEVSMLAELLPTAGAGVIAVTTAEPVPVSGDDGAVTTIVIGFPGPTANEPPIPHVTVLNPFEQLQPVPIAETKVAPAGSVAMTCVPSAGSGPAFVTSIV
jgi:hypothetical protein